MSKSVLTFAAVIGSTKTLCGFSIRALVSLHTVTVRVARISLPVKKAQTMFVPTASDNTALMIVELIPSANSRATEQRRKLNVRLSKLQQRVRGTVKKDGVKVPKLIALLKRRRKERVKLGDYVHLIANAESFPEFTAPLKFHWVFVPNVPIKLLEPGFREQYETDFTLDEDEIDQNLERYDAIDDLLATEEPWPIVVDEGGLVIDGNHRLAVLSDRGAKTVDVLWVRSK
jgi:hypothetical protein